MTYNKKTKATNTMITLNKLLNPYFVTGFSDAEANFYVKISRKNSMAVGWSVEPVFSIRLHHKDLNVLYLLQDFFGVGKVYHLEKIEEATFRVSAIKELEVIIRHFEAYPLLTNKLPDFLLFKQVLEIMKLKEHLKAEGLLKIANLKASMNTKTEIADIPNIVPVPLPLVPTVTVNNINPYWLAGFTSGDGCFSVSVIKSKATLGETSWIRFILTQHNRDETLLSVIAAYLGCGKINKDSKATNLVVQRLSDIINTIIPLFDEHKLQGIKVKDYEDFKSVANLMDKKAHLTRQGLEEIREIKNKMNTKRSIN